jgi:hypothetical protein
VLVSREIHFAAAKANSFHFEKEALLRGAFKAKLDLTA